MVVERQRAHVSHALNKLITRTTKRTCRKFKKKTILKKTHKCWINIPNLIWEMYNNSNHKWTNQVHIMPNTIISNKCIKHQDLTSTKNRMNKTWCHLCQHQSIILIIHHKIRGAIITWIDNHSSDKYDDRIQNKLKSIALISFKYELYIYDAIWYNAYTNL